MKRQILLLLGCISFGSQSIAQFNDDNNCSPGINSPAWNPEKYANWKRAVFRFRVGNNGNCTATLINQTGDGRPRQIMITSRHCIREGDFGEGPIINYNPVTRIITNAQAIFNFESNNGDNNAIPDQFAGPIFRSNRGEGIQNFRYPLTSDLLLLFETGISVLNIPGVTANGRDIAVLELLQPIPPHYNVHYVGWYPGLDLAIFAPPFNMIHHPGADAKKLARAPVFIPTTTTTVRSCRRVTRVVDFFLSLFRARFTSEVICNKIDVGQFIVPAFTVGASRGGSSGSPLFTTNGKIIGIYSANLFNQECNLVGFNTFGKFQNVYSHIKLRRELNPAWNELVNITGINGRNIDCYPDNPLILNGNYFPARDYQPENRIFIAAEQRIQAGTANLRVFDGADFTFRAGQEIVLEPGFSVDAGATFNTVIGACGAGRQAYEGYRPSVQFTKNEKPDPLTAYPNPTRDEVTFRYILPQAGRVTLSVADLTGRVVATAVDEEYEWKGSYERTFSTAKLPAGVYLYTLRVGSFQQTKRFVVVR